MTDEKKSKYLVNLNEVDQNIKTFVEITARPRGNDGERLINDKGEFAPVKIISAKENGSYRGRILANKDGLLIQAAGKNEQFAIVHNKEQVDIQGANLKKLNREEMLGDSSVQIHYKKDQAKMYPWNQKEHEAAIDKKIAEQETVLHDKELKNVPPELRTSAENLGTSQKDILVTKINAKAAAGLEAEITAAEKRVASKSINSDDVAQDQGMDR